MQRISQRRFTVYCSSYAVGARKLVRSRLEETSLTNPLFRDPYASSLLPVAKSMALEDARSIEDRRIDALVTHILDETLLEATSIVDPVHGDFNQVVLISPGLDTRPFRLPWRPGLVIYDVAPSEMHSTRKQLIEARAPSGCLHVPVAWNDGRDALRTCEDYGFRGDRLSVWAIQGLHLIEMSVDQLESLFVEISQMSKYKSLVVGELAWMDRSECVEFLSQFSLLGSVSNVTDESHSLQREIGLDSERCVFRVQQQLRSLAEHEIYTAHVQAAEETDEDFFGNFS